MSLLFGVLPLAFASTPSSAQSGVYAGGPVYIHRDYAINELKTSGFTYVVVWTIHIDGNGNMGFNGEFPLVENGNYIGNAKYPNFPSDIAALKQGTTTINRVEFSLSGWGSVTFGSIRDLINSQGTGSNSILYRNFKALKAAVPAIDAINFDDESVYDANTATRFAVMLADIGFKVTLVPYTRSDFWTTVATNTNNQRPGAIDRIDLQVYSGGGGNNPCNWNFNGVPVHPGVWSNEVSPQQTQTRMNDWKNSCGGNVKGGFMWLYDDFDNSGRVREYATAINNVFPIKPATPKSTGPLTLYQNCDFGGYSAGIPAGDRNLNDLLGRGVANDDISSFKLLPGYIARFFNDDNLTGSALTATGNDNCLVDNGFNDNVSSIQLKPNGDTTLSGRYFLRNRQSGLYMEVANSSQINSGNILQSYYVGAANQQFDFQHLGDGVYVIRNVSSGKAVDVSGISTENGANIFQWDYMGSGNQKLIALKDGNHHQLIATHSSKVVEIEGCTMADDGNVRQWDNNKQTCSYWELVPVGISGTPKLNRTIQAESFTSSSGVSTETTSDEGGGQNVGWIVTSSWMAYTDINIPTSGNYKIEYRVASPNSGTRLSLDLNAGAVQLGQVDIPNTGGWQNWKTVTHTVNINAGTYSLGVFAPIGGWNINWIRITSL